MDGTPGVHHRSGMVRPTTPAHVTATAAVGLFAAAIGTAAWLHMMASAPRHSFGAATDMGDTRYFPALAAVAGVGG